MAAVAEADVPATLPRRSPQVAAIVRLHLLTAARPGEICSIRPGEVDCSRRTWAYRPGSHMTQLRRRDRVIILGSRVQDVLRPWPDMDPDASGFSPAEVIASRGGVPAAAEKGTPRRPRPGGRYAKESYRVAIHRACRRAGVKPWSPHRLRHARAMSIRHEYDLEAAQISLGHSKPETTLIYAARDVDRAKDVMVRIG